MHYQYQLIIWPLKRRKRFGLVDQISLSVVMAIFPVNRYQNVSILDLIGAKDDGGGEW